MNKNQMQYQFLENLPDYYDRYQSDMNKRNLRNFLEALLLNCKNENRHFIQVVKKLMEMRTKLTYQDLRECILFVVDTFLAKAQKHEIIDYVSEDLCTLIPLHDIISNRVGRTTYAEWFDYLFGDQEHQPVFVQTISQRSDVATLRTAKLARVTLNLNQGATVDLSKTLEQSRGEVMQVIFDSNEFQHPTYAEAKEKIAILLTNLEQKYKYVNRREPTQPKPRHRRKKQKTVSFAPEHVVVLANSRTSSFTREELRSFGMFMGKPLFDKMFTIVQTLVYDSTQSNILNI